MILTFSLFCSCLKNSPLATLSRFTVLCTSPVLQLFFCFVFCVDIFFLGLVDRLVALAFALFAEFLLLADLLGACLLYNLICLSSFKRFLVKSVVSCVLTTIVIKPTSRSCLFSLFEFFLNTLNALIFTISLYLFDIFGCRLLLELLVLFRLRYTG